MKAQKDKSRKTVEQINAEIEKMNKKQLLEYVNQSLQANYSSLEEKLASTREIIAGSTIQLFGLSRRERKDMEKGAPDTDYVQAERTLQDLQNLRNRQRNPDINRTDQFELLQRDIQPKKETELNKNNVSDEQNIAQSEEALNYEDYRQTMSETWKEQDEQFKNAMNDLER